MMKLQIENKVYTRPNFILALILFVFFLKGLFLVSIFPIFGGQDESRHYNTVQYFAHSNNIVINESKGMTRDKEHIETYGFSEEIQNTAVYTDTSILRENMFNTIDFAHAHINTNESLIDSSQWGANVYFSQPETAGSGNLYHHLGAIIENIFSAKNILFRFYAIRIFSVFLGTLAILFFYLTTQEIGFSSKKSLLLTAIVAFQPKLAMYFCNINYDVLLIPLFFLFTLFGVMMIKNGPNWKNILALLAVSAAAFFTKLTGLILLVEFFLLITYLTYPKIKSLHKIFRYILFFGCGIALASLVIFVKKYISTDGQSLGNVFSSITDYLSKSLTFGRFGLTERTYWGTLDWTNNVFFNNLAEIFKYIELVSIGGIAFLFFYKKDIFDFLPAKKYLLFFILMILGLQFEIRMADWEVFNKLGRIELGTPGRYFLPNLGAHIILIFSGLGAILAYFKKEKYFDNFLISGLIFMFLFSTYLIFDTIIYRFYL